MLIKINTNLATGDGLEKKLSEAAGHGRIRNDEDALAQRGKLQSRFDLILAEKIRRTYDAQDCRRC